MANFQNNAITDSGRALLSHVQMGAVVLRRQKFVVGSGYMPPGKTARTMTDVVTPVKNLTINKKQRTNDGKAIFRRRVLQPGHLTGLVFQGAGSVCQGGIPGGTRDRRVPVFLR